MRAEPALRLRDQERELVLAELETIREASSSPVYRKRVERLVRAAREGALDDELASELERILELALQSGRIRAVYGPGGEQAALKLYRRTPGGADVVASAAEVSEALGALAGKPLESVDVAVVGPGAYRLSLTAGGLELAVRLDRQGARLASVGA
jgi:hypothetical protein